MKKNKKVLLAVLATLCLSAASVGGASLIGASAADVDSTPTVFKAVDGASVKLMTDKTDSGIRFSYMMEQEYYYSLLNESAFKDGVSVTAYIVPTDMVSEATADAIIADEDTAAKTIDASKWRVYQELQEDELVDYVDENGDKWMISYSYLYDLPSVSYARSISAVAQVIDGSNTYTSDVVSSSMVEVANDLLYVQKWTGDGSEILKEYLSGYSYELSLNKTSAKLFYSATEDVEDEVTLTANTNLPTEVTWSSNNNEVATVDANGKVTAVGKGTATITATVTASGETATCTVTVQNYYTVSSVDEFWAIENDMAGYYVLTKDIDFENVAHIGLGASAKQDWSYNATAFTGTVDGNGFSLLNFKTFPANQSGYTVTDGNPFNQVVFSHVSGTIKNLGAYITLDCRNTNVREGGFIGTVNSGAVIENCFAKITTTSFAYNQYGVGFVTIGKGGSIKNCVSVIDIETGFTGNTTNYGAILGNVYTADSKPMVENCYGVLVQSGSIALQLVNNHSSANASAATVVNSYAVASLANLFTAISADGVLTTANGWNTKVWAITNTEESKTLKFGDETIYEYIPVEATLDGGFYSLKDAQDYVASNCFEGTVTDVIYSGNSVVSSCDTSVEGSLTVPAAVMAQLGTGEKEITVKTTAGNYTVNLTVATDIITTLDEFWAIDDSTTAMAGYYVLGSDLNFSGTTLNVDQTIQNWHSIGWVKDADIDAWIPFTGVFDGNGYALKNIVMAGDTGTRGIYASLFGYVYGGTIKNTYIDMEILNTGNNVKCAGMVAYLRNGRINNCYVSLKTQYLSYQSTANVGPICGTKAGTSYLDNCVGVLDVSAGILGTATTAGCLTGEFNGYANNCYGVAIKAEGNANSYNLCGAGWMGGSNNVAVESYAALYTAMSANGVLTDANGWNTAIWKVIDGALYFGNGTDTTTLNVIYKA